MKIRLLQDYANGNLPKGTPGEALSFRITMSSVTLQCVFYGHPGIYEVDVRDARPLTETW